MADERTFVNDHGDTMTGSLDIAGVTTETKSLRIGPGRTGPTGGASQLDLHGEAAVGFRVVRSAGANATTTMLHWGTNPLTIGAVDTGVVNFYTNGGERLVIGETSSYFHNTKLGVGETAPNGTLHVKTSDIGAYTPSVEADDFIIEVNGTGGMSIMTPEVASKGVILFGTPPMTTYGSVEFNHPTNAVLLKTLGVNALVIPGNQRVGIGIDAPATRLHVKEANTSQLDILRLSAEHATYTGSLLETN